MGNPNLLNQYGAAMGAAQMFQKTVTGASTATQLAPAGTYTAARYVKIKPTTGSTGPIYIGGSNAVTAANGYPLSASVDLELAVNDPAALWIFSATATDTVCVTVI